MSRSDWKCSPVHKYWLNKSKWSFSTQITEGARYVYPMVGEWVTRREVCYLMASVTKNSCFDLPCYKETRSLRCVCNMGYPSGTHLNSDWGRVKHICVSNLTTIGSVNGLSPGRRQAITWTNAGILLIGPLGTNFSEILIGIPTFFIQENACESIVCEMTAILSRPQCVKFKSRETSFPHNTRLGCPIVSKLYTHHGGITMANWELSYGRTRVHVIWG